MSWDGLYRARTHYRAKRGEPVACKRRFVKATTGKKEHVSCFACMKKLGMIK